MKGKRQRLGMKMKYGYLLMIVVIVLVAVLFLLKDNELFSSETKNTGDLEKVLVKFKENYSSYVVTTKEIILYDSSFKEVGMVSSDTEISLDDEYEITSYYYKLKDGDYYISRDGIKVTSEPSNYDNNEYKTYKNYIPYNSNIITNESYSMYVSDKVIYRVNKSDTYVIIVQDNDYYGVEFNDRLVYISKSDVSEIVESSNTSEEYATSIAVLNYHYTVNKEAGELEECTQTICMEDVQVEEEIKYLSDNGYYATTMRDLELFVLGKINLPVKSVTITIDDGWYLARMIAILEKYQLMGTLFLIGSVAEPSDYLSDYLEVHSHSWNMHTPGVCSGSHGGGILCLDSDKVLDDLKKSRESLNNTTYFCYPFYEYNDRSKGLLQEAGFTMAFIGGDKKVFVGDDIYTLHRFELVNYTDMETFISYVS